MMFYRCEPHGKGTLEDGPTRSCSTADSRALASRELSRLQISSSIVANERNDLVGTGTGGQVSVCSLQLPLKVLVLHRSYWSGVDELKVLWLHFVLERLWP